MKNEDLKVRLIKLIDEGKRAYCSICPNCDKDNCEECENARVADHLINNGVTIRLPKKVRKQKHCSLCDMPLLEDEKTCPACGCEYER